ncbi:MAG: hypothetical protein ABSB79_15250 [Syntrophales bacterium]|jgi:hypothetical protein
MDSWFWWLKIIFISFLSIFFLIFGINELITAYSLRDPHVFIMYFFSSNLLILISAVGLIYALFQLHGNFKTKNIREDNHHG